ncbi:hypothetical protein WL16_27675 [Burkholderia ubonensis]|nr:hypothetical protein WJ77_06255 [Burkholderia ubonensis]KVU69819.1 hypothetical protein WK73_21755 [Burkholderia ubonensis]KVZ42085.1 hypothetical protein WL16_27675 [Burkholderia ubonensis]OJA25042.1 hypothetical protein BGX87_25000 [Burkholderia ubonensis]OJA63323.1 hypothetical protein BGV70_25350 [Burkholderia ubonensis]
MNASHGIETTLVLDTNLLIAMERVVKDGNKTSLLKKYGLHNLVSLLNRCPPNSICISPGLALDEMPPALAERCRLHYEAFCLQHLPSFCDTPNCIHATFSGKEADYGFLDLESVAQALLAVPFTALLYLNIVDKQFKGSPIQKFEAFMARMANDLDMLSTKEIDIAKYCLAEPPATATETIRLKRLFRTNFLKMKKDKAIRTAQDAMAVAFNGACDLTLINSANVIQSRGLDEIPQDCWIATRDKKLFEFSRVAHYLDLDGNAGQFSLSTVLTEHMNDEYWIAANDLHQSVSRTRLNYHLSRKIDPFTYVDTAKAAIEETRLAFQND